jgi:hypothetical protein
LPAPFDGCIERETRVTATALVHVDRNRYSVDCRYAGKTVSLRTYADRIVMMAEGKIVGEHVRSFERDRTFFDPWHYVAALEKKPGALRNGAPFKDWALPPALREMKERLCARAGPCVGSGLQWPAAEITVCTRPCAAARHRRAGLIRKRQHAAWRHFSFKPLTRAAMGRAAIALS